MKEESKESERRGERARSRRRAASPCAAAGGAAPTAAPTPPRPASSWTASPATASSLRSGRGTRSCRPAGTRGRRGGAGGGRWRRRSRRNTLHSEGEGAGKWGGGGAAGRELEEGRKEVGEKSVCFRFFPFCNVSAREREKERGKKNTKFPFLQNTPSLIPSQKPCPRHPRAPERCTPSRPARRRSSRRTPAASQTSRPEPARPGERTPPRRP